MARIEAPAGAKAAGNSYSPEPVVTAPVVDSTGLGQKPQKRTASSRVFFPYNQCIIAHNTSYVKSGAGRPAGVAPARHRGERRAGVDPALAADANHRRRADAADDQQAMEV
jgi:hypothetical protein